MQLWTQSQTSVLACPHTDGDKLDWSHLCLDAWVGTPSVVHHA